MCGIVGVISKLKGGLYHSDVKIFTEMLYADQVRGVDGTGIFYNKGKKIETLKAACPSSEFIVHPMYDKAEGAAVMSGNFMVGHNRAATKGKLDHKNTHPFREGHITLIHNGTLTRHKELANTENDSNAIAVSFAKIGAKETLKKLNGAFTLVWYDSKQNTLNFVRNSQRPLFLISTKDLFVFASERGLAEWICTRNGQTPISVLDVPVNTLFQFEHGTWDKYETQKVDVYTTPPFIGDKSIRPYTPPSYTEGGYKLGETIKFVATEIESEFGVKLIGEYEDPYGETISVSYWTKDKKDAERLLMAGVLCGKISHEIYNTTTKVTKLVLSNVGIYEPPPLLEDKTGVVTTHNNLTLTNKEVKEIDNRCSYCTGIFNKKLLHACNVTKKSDGTYSALCPDCTDWFEEKSAPFQQYGV